MRDFNRCFILRRDPSRVTVEKLGPGLRSTSSCPSLPRSLLYFPGSRTARARNDFLRGAVEIVHTIFSAMVVLRTSAARWLSKLQEDRTGHHEKASRMLASEC